MNLFIFQKITEDPVISALLSFKETGNENAYFDAARGLITFSSVRITDKNIIKEYILRKMLTKDSLPDISNLRDFLRHDVKTIYLELFDVDWDGLAKDGGFLPFSAIGTAPLPHNNRGYVLSLESMIDCTSNEALGGALLAHAESFPLA